MKKCSFGALLVLLALGIMLGGCQTEAEEDFPDFTVTFVANNGTDQPDTTVTIKGDKKLGAYVPAGGTVSFENASRPVVPIYSAPTGRRLRRWNTEANGSGRFYFGDNRVTQNMTLYAEWEGTYNYNHYWTRQLQYDSFGGRDSDGIYTYKLAVPVSELQVHPTAANYTNIRGQIKTGKSFKVGLGYFSPDNGTDPDMRLNRGVQTLKLQLWDGKANKALSNVIEKSDVGQGIQIVFTDGDVFSTTADATDSSPEANQLLITATNNLLVDKITVHGTVKLEPVEADAIVDTGNADVLHNFESFAHNSGTYTGLFAVNGNAAAGVVQTDDFAYVRVNNSTAKALLVSQLTANTTTAGSLPKVQVTLPAGKTLEDYAGVQIRYMGLSGNSVKNNVIMVGQNLTSENYSNAVATAANAGTKKTIAAGTGAAQSGATYNSYPFFPWFIRTVTFAATGGVPTVIAAAGNSFEMAFGLHATDPGVTYLVDEIVLQGRPAREDDPATADVNEAYAGTGNFVVANFENSPVISKTGDGIIYTIVDLDMFATYKGKYGKVFFGHSNGAGDIPGMRYTLPAKDPAVSYNKISFTYMALTPQADSKTIAVKIGADADSAKAAAGLTVESGDASIFKTLTVNLSSPLSSDGSNIFLGIGPSNGSAGAIYLIDDITLYY